MDSLPLHLCTLHTSATIINRSHAFFHSMALLALLYYRASSFYLYATAPSHLLTWLLVFASELFLSFLWLLSQAYQWRPVTRTVFPETFPEDRELGAIDVFICTADPKKEPPVKVMNTVLSAMALDYPPEKVVVYLSDDGGSSLTLNAIREAWRFARLWIPFCKAYGIRTRCPEAYFSKEEEDDDQFVEEREKIKVWVKSHMSYAYLYIWFQLIDMNFLMWWLCRGITSCLRSVWWERVEKMRLNKEWALLVIIILR